MIHAWDEVECTHCEGTGRLPLTDDNGLTRTIFGEHVTVECDYCGGRGIYSPGDVQ